MKREEFEKIIKYCKENDKDSHMNVDMIFLAGPKNPHPIMTKDAVMVAERVKKTQGYVQWEDGI